MRHLFAALTLLLASFTKPTFADTAHFHSDSGVWTASVNGSPITLPSGFGVSIESSVFPDGDVFYQVYSYDARPNSYSDVWVSGICEGSLWDNFGGSSRGAFAHWNELGGTAPSGMSLVLDNYPMVTLSGEPIYISVAPPTIDIQIGPPPAVRRMQDLFDFLEAWFTGTTTMSLFEFLSCWFIT